jgi:hypothetical protein
MPLFTPVCTRSATPLPEPNNSLKQVLKALLRQWLLPSDIVLCSLQNQIAIMAINTAAAAKQVL